MLLISLYQVSTAPSQEGEGGGGQSSERARTPTCRPNLVYKNALPAHLLLGRTAQAGLRALIEQVLDLN